MGGGTPGGRELARGFLSISPIPLISTLLLPHLLRAFTFRHAWAIKRWVWGGGVEGAWEDERERAEYSERRLLFFWQDGWMVLSPEHVSQCLSLSVTTSNYSRLTPSLCLLIIFVSYFAIIKDFRFDAKNPTSQITTTYHWSSPFLCSRWRWRQSELTLMKQGQSGSGDGFKWFILFKWRTSLKN